MVYYHVFLASADSPERLECALADLSEQTLETAFLAPYRRGEDIACELGVVPFADIEKITITRTRDRRPPGAGEDVTAHYLPAPPTLRNGVVTELVFRLGWS